MGEGKPVSVQVQLLLAKRPHTYPQLWQAIGADAKKAIRSTVDKKTVLGIYKRNDKTGEYSLAPAKPVKAAPKKSVKKATKKPAAEPTVAPKMLVRNDKTPPASTSGAQTELTV